MADPNGIIARTLVAMRYAVTGSAPATWFGPGAPITPQAPPEVRGRQFDYPVSINLNYTPRSSERIGFAQLKALADTCGTLRMIIERQKNLVKALEWQIKPRLKPSNDAPPLDPAVAKITSFLERPDGHHDWSQWLNALLEQVLVYDALSIYARPTRGGDLYALEILDGATISPLLDEGGRTPAAPDAAYQQILKGVPTANYATTELLYYPENYRPDRVYGYSRVEHIVDIGNASIQRLKSQLGYFTHGNIGDGYFTAPEKFSAAQVSAVETHWNDMMTASIAGRRQSLFLPHGFDWRGTKTDVLQDVFDEWLIKLVCFGFGVSPQPFLKQTGLGHAGAETQQEAAQEGGIAPLMQFVQRTMNRVLAQWFGRADLEFSWSQDREFDPEVAAKIDDQRLKNGTRTLNEVRDRNGEPPIEGGDQPLLFVGSAWVKLSDVLVTPEPPKSPPATGAAAIPEHPGPEVNAALGDGLANHDGLAKAASNAQVNRLGKLLAAYLAKRADDVATRLGDALGLVKTAMDDYSGQIDSAYEAVDWTWSDLPPLIGPGIAGIAVPAGVDAISELGLFDAKVIAKVTERATAYATDRAATMVGMKLVDGEFVENPNADWSITEATRDMLRSTITEAMERGASNDDLAKAIRESAAFGKDRAMNIARTESAMADLNGQKIGWRASGLVAGRQWDAAPDCCDECQGYDGQIIGIDEEWPFGDVPHPQCRCSESAVLPEDMPGAAAGDDENNDE